MPCGYTRRPPSLRDAGEAEEPGVVRVSRPAVRYSPLGSLKKEALVPEENLTNHEPSHEISLRVRYAETDQMGVVHHSAYFVWFEEARSDFMRARGSSYAEFERAGLMLPLSEASARYLAPARYDELVKVRVWIEELRSRALTFGYEVRSAASGQTLATGRTTHVVTTTSGKVVPWPPEWRARILNPVAATNSDRQQGKEQV